MNRLGHIRAVVLAGLALAISGVTPALPATTQATKEATGDPAYEAFERGQYLKALEEAKKAAGRGEPAAHTLIGEIYARGLGVVRNYAKAAEWYGKGAKLGEADSQLGLGLLYAEGKGVKEDRRRAADLFEKAAAKNLAAAQYNLALILIDGIGRKQDFKRAAELLQKAAAPGPRSGSI